MTQRNQINLKAASFLAPIWKNSRCVVWGVITAKIKFAILLCCLPMRFLILFRMLQIVFNMFSLMFAKMSLLFCCFCILLFGTNNVCFVPYGVMRNLDAIICVRMVLCETRCYYSWFELCSSKSGSYESFDIWGTLNFRSTRNSSCSWGNIYFGLPG